MAINLKEKHEALGERRLSYSGDVVSVGQELEADLVIPERPKSGKACVCPIIEVIDTHLVDEFRDPRNSLLPESEWLAVTPVSKVHATMSEWYRLVQAAHARNLFVDVAEDEISRNQHEDLVLNGPMGVNKMRMVDGVEVKLLRFIYKRIRRNQYMRKSNGDSSLLPQASTLTHMLLEDGELVWGGGEDLQSCFNLSS